MQQSILSVLMIRNIYDTCARDLWISVILRHDLHLISLWFKVLVHGNVIHTQRLNQILVDLVRIQLVPIYNNKTQTY